MAALVQSNVKVLDRGNIARRKRREVTITGDTSYPTGGWPITPGLFELRSITAIDFSHATLGGAYSGNVVRYDSANSKLLVLSAAGVEVANATNLSTFVATLVVEGIG